MDAEHTVEPVDKHPSDDRPEDPLAAQGWDRQREARLQRQFDVHAAAKASVARQHLRDVRRLALRGQYSYHDVRQARREYLRAKSVAPSVWLWGPDRADRETRQAA